MNSRGMSPALGKALHVALIFHVYSMFGLWILDRPWISLVIVPPLIALRPVWTAIAASAMTLVWLYGRAFVPGDLVYSGGPYIVACAIVPLVLLAGLYSGRLISPDLSTRRRGFLRALCVWTGIIALFVSASRQTPLAAMLFLCASNWIGAFAIPRGHTRRTGPRWATAALTATSLLVSLALLETGARLFIARARPPTRIFIPHATAIVDLRPSITANVKFRATDSMMGSLPITISRQQIRELTYGPKAPDEFRILLIGDSFTFGLAVPFFQTIGQQLERVFAGEPGPKRVTVINMGVPGTAPWQQQIYLNERGFAFDPDLVIQQLYLGNDVHDTVARDGHHLRAFLPERDAQIDGQRIRALGRFRAESWLVDRSCAYAALRTWIGGEEVTRFLQTGCRWLPPRPREALLDSEPLPAGWEVNRVPWYPELYDAVESIVATLRETRESCASRGIGYLAYTVPLREEAAPQLFERARTVMGVPRDAQYQMGKGLRYLDARLGALGIGSIPVLSCMREDPFPERLYIPGDGHTSGEGDAVIAKCIHDYLTLHYFPEHPMARTLPVDRARVSK